MRRYKNAVGLSLKRCFARWCRYYFMRSLLFFVSLDTNDVNTVNRVKIFYGFCFISIDDYDSNCDLIVITIVICFQEHLLMIVSKILEFYSLLQNTVFKF